MIRVFIAVVLLGASTAHASIWYSTRAMSDGLGYRSNLIDIANPYAVSKSRNFRVLLKRLGIEIVSEFARAPDEGPTYEEYSDSVREILKRKEIVEPIDLSVPDYVKKRNWFFQQWTLRDRYWVVESTNNFATAKSFMMVVSETVSDKGVVAKLVSLRHELLQYGAPDTLGEIAANILERLRSNHLNGARNSARYLEGAVLFYALMFAEAADAFGLVGTTESPWLTETAAYMVVRATLAAEQTKRLYYFTNGSIDPEKLKSSLKDIEDYVTRYPNGGYARTLINSKRQIWYLLDEDDSLRKEIRAQFPWYFGDTVNVHERSRFLHKEIFRFGIGDPDSRSDHPLALAAGALWAAKIPCEEMLAELKSREREFIPYPGLSRFLEAKCHFKLGNHTKVMEVAERIASDGGSFLPDGLALAARSAFALSRYADSRRFWERVHSAAPTYNAMTEIGRTFLARKDFVGLAKYRFDPLTKYSAAKNIRAIDEFEIDPKVYVAAMRPHERTVQQVFAYLAAEDDLENVLADDDVTPGIKLLAALPTLNRRLIEGDHAGYQEFVARFVGRAFKSKLLREEQEHLMPQLDRVRRIDSRLRILEKTPDDAKTLLEVGYHIYSESIHPPCLYSPSLFIETHAQACREYDDKLEAWAKDMTGTLPRREIELNSYEKRQAIVWEGTQAPIDLFVRVLKNFEGSPTKYPDEAKVLRILIHCFKASINVHNCVRHREADYPKSARHAWFSRLHTKFPELAKKTPYWY